MDKVMRELRLRRDRPLVRVNEEPSAVNGYAIGFVFADRVHGGFEYDFYCRSPLDALDWVRQTAGKTWVTTEHLEQFADLALSRFDPPRKAA
ncbi:hypothetical protein [Lysobacter panacisoli]|nr:hypothetical protein [Lysobacter panacisoli]